MIDKVFDFPGVLDVPDFVKVDQYDEGPVPRRSPGLAPSSSHRPSVYRLHRVTDNEQMVELTVFDIENFSYEPPVNHIPRGLVRWYVKHPGDSRFTEYGFPFRYRESWDRDE